jgi:hypothetical protein
MIVRTEEVVEAASAQAAKAFQQSTQALQQVSALFLFDQELTVPHACLCLYPSMAKPSGGVNNSQAVLEVVCFYADYCQIASTNPS